MPLTDISAKAAKPHRKRPSLEFDKSSGKKINPKPQKPTKSRLFAADFFSCLRLRKGSISRRFKEDHSQTRSKGITQVIGGSVHQGKKRQDRQSPIQIWPVQPGKTLLNPIQTY
jgi:hypothetical protein